MYILASADESWKSSLLNTSKYYAYHRRVKDLRHCLQLCDDKGLLQEHDASLAKAISIIYIVCGRKDEFLASLKSLHLFAKAAITSPEDVFRIHVITDDTVSPCCHSFQLHVCILQAQQHGQHHHSVSKPSLFRPRDMIIEAEQGGCRAELIARCVKCRPRH